MVQISGDNQAVLWIAMIFGKIDRKKQECRATALSLPGILCLQQHPPHIPQHLGKVSTEAGCVRAVNDAMVE